MRRHLLWHKSTDDQSLGTQAWMHLSWEVPSARDWQLLGGSPFRQHSEVLKNSDSTNVAAQVLQAHAGVLREIGQSLQWAGYISSTGVYGDWQGDWVDERYRSPQSFHEIVMMKVSDCTGLLLATPNAQACKGPSQASATPVHSLFPKCCPSGSHHIW